MKLTEGMLFYLTSIRFENEIAALNKKIINEFIRTIVQSPNFLQQLDNSEYKGTGSFTNLTTLTKSNE